MGMLPVNPYQMNPLMNSDPSGWNGKQPGVGYNGQMPTQRYLGSINGQAPSASSHWLAGGFDPKNPNAPTAGSGPYTPPGFIGNLNGLGSGYWNAPQYASYINTVNPAAPQQALNGPGPDYSQGGRSNVANQPIYAPTWASFSPQTVAGPNGQPLPYQAQQGSQYSMNLPGGGTWTPQGAGVGFDPNNPMSVMMNPGGMGPAGTPAPYQTPVGAPSQYVPGSVAPLPGQSAQANPSGPTASSFGPGNDSSTINPAGQGAAPYGTTQFSGNGTYPGQTPGGGAPSNGAGSMSPDQWMASSGGTPINTTPAWSAMVAAESMNNQRQFQNVNEAFNVGGGRFSTAFGDAAQNYWGQTALSQNAQLTAAQTAAMETAAGRNNSNMQQLSSQDFQSMMQQYQIAAGLAGQQYATTTGSGAAAGSQQYGASTQADLASAQTQALWQQYLTLGGQIGGTQYNAQQQNLPQYNPMLAYIMQMTGMYPGTAQNGYGPSAFSQVFNPILQGAGMVGAAFAGA